MRLKNREHIRLSSSRMELLMEYINSFTDMIQRHFHAILEVYFHAKWFYGNHIVLWVGESKFTQSTSPFHWLTSNIWLTCPQNKDCTKDKVFLRAEYIYTHFNVSRKLWHIVNERLVDLIWRNIKLLSRSIIDIELRL